MVGARAQQAAPLHASPIMRRDAPRRTSATARSYASLSLGGRGEPIVSRNTSAAPHNVAARSILPLSPARLANTSREYAASGPPGSPLFRSRLANASRE